MTTYWPYVVQQGDHMLKLAHQRGFDADAIWNHPRNAGLKAKRPNMNILFAGDVLFLPDTKGSAARLERGKVNHYVARARMISVHVVLHKAGGAPVADTDCWVHGPGGVTKRQTLADGTLSFDVPSGTREVRVVVDRCDATISVLIGDLDPISELSGVRQRLAARGMWKPPEPDFVSGFPPEMLAEYEAKALRVGIERFQRQQALDCSGELDDRTRQALHDAFGC